MKTAHVAVLAVVAAAAVGGGVYWWRRRQAPAAAPLLPAAEVKASGVQLPKVAPAVMSGSAVITSLLGTPAVVAGGSTGVVAKTTQVAAVGGIVAPTPTVSVEDKTSLLRLAGSTGIVPPGLLQAARMRNLM